MYIYFECFFKRLKKLNKKDRKKFNEISVFEITKSNLMIYKIYIFHVRKKNRKIIMLFSFPL